MNPLLLAGLLASAPYAIPQSSSAPAEETPRWYGWQTLLVDGGSLGFALLALHDLNTSASKPLFITSAVLYFAGAPTVHFLHGNAPEGIGDVLYRAGLPLAAGFLGAIIGSRGADDVGGGLYGGLIVLVVGGVAASAIDAIWLAREPEQSPLRPRFLATVSFWRGRDGLQHPAAALVASF